MKTRYPWRLLLLLVLLSSSRSPLRAEESGDALKRAAELMEQANALHREARYEKAAQLWEEALRVAPGRHQLLYNLACAYARMGRTAEALERLAQSIPAGMLNFDHIEGDPDLVSLREEPAYKSLIGRKDELLAEFVKTSREKIIADLGGSYTQFQAPADRMLVVSDLSAQERENVIALLRNFSKCLAADLFHHPPTRDIMIVLPSNTQDYIQKLGRPPGTAGRYIHLTGVLLANLATGLGTVAHELTHALHFADQEGLKQQHPQWISEGIGSLYEQCGEQNGHIIGTVNWRFPIVLRAVNNDSAFPLAEFVARSEEHFQRDASLSYAMARYLLYFLQEKGLLTTWYAQYTETYAEDATGRKALQAVYGKPLAQFESDWLAFLRKIGGDVPAGP